MQITKELLIGIGFELQDYKILELDVFTLNNFKVLFDNTNNFSYTYQKLNYSKDKHLYKILDLKDLIQEIIADSYVDGTKER